MSGSDRTDYSVPKDTPHPKLAKARADALARVEARMLEALLGHASTHELRVGDVTFFARFAKQLAADAICAFEEAQP